MRLATIVGSTSVRSARRRPARDHGALDQLTAALQKAVADPEVRARLEGMGISAVSPEQATPAALRAHLKQEIDTLGPLLVKAGVKAN